MLISITRVREKKNYRAIMTDTKPTLLRLRVSTVDKLKAAVANSAHRSMASLADEILDNALTLNEEKPVIAQRINQMIGANK